MKRVSKCGLVAMGWYLLAPPLGHEPSIDTKAPFSQWRIAGSYDTKADCEDVRLRMFNAVPGEHSASNAGWHYVSRMSCIATDDPRLKQQ